MIREIVTFPNVVLRRKSIRAENDKDTQILIQDLLDTMQHNNGAGLAANQINVDKRVIATNHINYPIVINPMILYKSKETVFNNERCLSLPGESYPVKRHECITVAGYDRNFYPIMIDADGLFSVVLQHEIDHLDGKLIIDFS